jgi:NADP-dependent aldehyde dehydrogenase
VDGEATGYRFIGFPRGSRSGLENAQPLPSIHRPRRSSGRTFSALPDELDALGEDVLHRRTGDKRCRWRGCRETGAHQRPVRMFAGVILRGDTFAARIDTALADRQPLPRRTCASISRR